VLEGISPAGFERYFAELAPLIPADGPPDMEAMASLWERYGLATDMASVPHLVETHGLAFGGPPGDASARPPTRRPGRRRIVGA
jgi:hypothetical protein